MTRHYNTPDVLHIQECDSEGNKHIVRYYRESTIQGLLNKLKCAISSIEKEADAPGEDRWFSDHDRKLQYTEGYDYTKSELENIKLGNGITREIPQGIESGNTIL